MTPEIGKNMMLIKAHWEGHDTFKMIPVTEDCPYTEVIYDRRLPILAVISKIPIEKMMMLPRLDDKGNPQQTTGKANGKTYKEQRAFVKTYQEYYFQGEEQVKEFVEMFAVNADTFDYKEFLPRLEPKAVMTEVDAGKILDENGNPIEVKTQA